MEGRLEPIDSEYACQHLGELWGWPVITPLRTYTADDQLHGMVWRDEWGSIQGLIVWHTEADNAEIISIDAYQQGRHIGGRLLDGAEAELRKRGVQSVAITTTNDNLRAITFYVRRGYRLVGLELDGMDRVRAVKPDVPETGQDGIPLRDMLVLEKQFA